MARAGAAGTLTPQEQGGRGDPVRPPSKLGSASLHYFQSARRRDGVRRGAVEGKAGLESPAVEGRSGG
jgi:hypothetical protein